MYYNLKNFGIKGRKMAVSPSGIRLLTIAPLLAMRSPSSGGGVFLAKGFCNADRFDVWLQRCSDIRTLQKLHACILVRGLDDRAPLVPTLLNRYADIGSLSESRQVFDRIVDRDLSHWNSAIVGYFRAGQFEEVFWLYLNLKLQGIGVDSSSVTFGLKSCIELSDVLSGRRIHVDACKTGLNAGKFVGSSLVGLYSRCGSIEDAHRAFEEILDKDIVAYTAMITGYARFSDSRALMAFEIARDVVREGVGVNRVTLVSLLQAAGHLEAPKEGRSIHCYALRRGIGLSDDVFETSLVDMYSRCGIAFVAASLLRQSKRTNVASWNAMIASLVHRGQSYEALRFFSIMGREAKVSPDLVTLANVLTACSDSNCDYNVTSIHGYLIRRELPLDLVAVTVLIDAYSRYGKIKYAREVFNQLLEGDTILYNVMISGYHQNGKVDEAMEMFNNMVKRGVRPNSATVLSLLSAFSEVSDMSKGSLIHGFVVRTGLESDVNVSNQILYMYAKCMCIDAARKIFNSIIEKDLISWTAMMMCYVETGHAEDALALFQLMQGTRERPDSVALITILQALSQLGCLKHVKEVHGYIHRICFSSDTDTNNTLINTYSKCGNLRSAKNVFYSMAERILTSWNTMIAAYGMHGYCREALKVFNLMQRQCIKPDEVTFTSLFSACSHSGLVKEAWQLFCSMDSVYSISPEEEHYGCMVDLLGRAGQLEEAYEFVKCSPVKDKASALCALLTACRVHGNTKLGEVIGRQLLNLEPQNTRNYALISNIYAQSSKWSQSEELRILASERGLWKVPGYSLISD